MADEIPADVKRRALAHTAFIGDDKLRGTAISQMQKAIMADRASDARLAVARAEGMMRAAEIAARDSRSDFAKRYRVVHPLQTTIVEDIRAEAEKEAGK